MSPTKTSTTIATLTTALLAAAQLSLMGCGGDHEQRPVTQPDGGVDAAIEAALDSAPQDAGADAEADTEAATGCAPLGTPCATSADCYCGTGAGCAWDNVTCGDAGDASCTVAYLPPLDAGAECCSACEHAYDQGEAGVAEWLACSAACGATCPVRCLGRQ